MIFAVRTHSRVRFFALQSISILDEGTDALQIVHVLGHWVVFLRRTCCERKAKPTKRCWFLLIGCRLNLCVRAAESI